MSKSNYIRHLRLGSGRVLNSDNDKYSIIFRSADGSLSSERRIDKSPTLVREISSDSLGAIFVEEPNRIYDLVNRNDTEIVVLTLKELNGEALQKDIKNCLEPIVVYQGQVWKDWWKKISQKLKHSKTIKLDSVKNKYFLSENSYQISNLDKLKSGEIQAFTKDDFIRTSQSLLEFTTELKAINRHALTLLWNRLCEVIQESSPISTEIVGLIAFGESLSNIIPVRNQWDSFLINWLNGRELNISGIRDANLRYLALQSVTRIDWPQKAYTLALYIVAEESSEKNRSAAMRSLWDIKQYQPKAVFPLLIKAARKIDIRSNAALPKISSKAERILLCLVPYANNIDDEELIKQYCVSCVDILLSLISQVTKVPMDFAAAKKILDICFLWRNKTVNTLHIEHQWTTWLIYVPILKACEEYAIHKYLADNNLLDQMVSDLSDIIVEKANQGQIDVAEKFYSMLILVTEGSKATQQLSILYDHGMFKSNDAINWALSYIVGEQSTVNVSEQEKIQLAELSDYTYHQRETEIAIDYSRFLLFLKERENVIKNIYSSYEELVNFYDQTKVDMVHHMNSFFESLNKHAETLRILLNLEYIETVGKKEEYNPNRHQLIGDANSAPKYVNILIPGIGRRTNNGPFEILQKAIVKSI